MAGSNLQGMRLGFIGGSLDSAIGKTHFIASQMDGRWQLASGCFSRDKDKSRRAAEVYGLESTKSYFDWKSFLNNEAELLDAVAVLVDSPQHFELLAELIKRKIPVICEKPLCISLHEAEKIRDELKKNRGFLVTTFNYTGYPMLRELKARIEKGLLGECRQILLEMPQDGYLQNLHRIQAWRKRDPEIPMLCLDLGTHLHQMILFLTGLEPSRVCGEFGSDSEVGVIDKAHILFGFNSGATGSMWFTKASSGDRNSLKIKVIGTKASASWSQEKAEELRWNFSGGDRTLIDRGSPGLLADYGVSNRMKPGHPAGFVEAFANLYEDIANGLEQFKKIGTCNSPYLSSIEQSISGLRFFESSVKSSQLRSWVEINSPTKD